MPAVLNCLMLHVPQPFKEISPIQSLITQAISITPFGPYSVRLQWVDNNVLQDSLVYNSLTPTTPRRMTLGPGKVVAVSYWIPCRNTSTDWDNAERLADAREQSESSRGAGRTPSAGLPHPSFKEEGAGKRCWEPVWGQRSRRSRMQQERRRRPTLVAVGRRWRGGLSGRAGDEGWAATGGASLTDQCRSAVRSGFKNWLTVRSVTATTCCYTQPLTR